MRPAPEAPEGVVVPEARELQERAPQFDSHAVGYSVLRSMALPKDKGKMLSDNGAVRCRTGDPCHYVCPVDGGVSYFDPMTRIYSVALSMLAPQLEAQGWNKGARGDICESLMGVH